MKVVLVEAVLESSMGRMRRSRMCMKQERESVLNDTVIIKMINVALLLYPILGLAL